MNQTLKRWREILTFASSGNTATVKTIDIPVNVSVQVVVLDNNTFEVTADVNGSEQKASGTVDKRRIRGSGAASDAASGAASGTDGKGDRKNIAFDAESLAAPSAKVMEGWASEPDDSDVDPHVLESVEYMARNALVGEKAGGNGFGPGYMGTASEDGDIQWRRAVDNLAKNETILDARSDPEDKHAEQRDLVNYLYEMDPLIIWNMARELMMRRKNRY